MDLAPFIRDYGSALAWGVAAVGWLVANKQANKREQRKEIRAEIDAIEKLIKDGILQKLSTYFDLAERNAEAKKLELAIKVHFKEVDMKFIRIAKREKGGTRGLLLDQCKTQMWNFFNSSTGKYFEVNERIPAEQKNDHISKISIDAFMFIEELHNLFLKKFGDI